MRGSDFSPLGGTGSQAGDESSPTRRVHGSDREEPELSGQSADTAPGEESLAAYLWRTAVIRVITMIAVRLGY